MLKVGLHHAAAKLGARYPLAVVVAQFWIGHLVAFGGIALLTFYTDMSSGEFLRIVAVSQALVFMENLYTTRVAVSLLGPVRAWLEGDRGEHTTVAAWLRAAGLPGQVGRRLGVLPFFLSVVPICAYIVWELELPAYSLPALIAGGAVILLYGATLRYLAIDLAMRPVLERISPHLPDHFVIGQPGVPLRWKLLAVLPLINVITGVLVSGLSGNGSGSVGDLGLDVLLAVLVAFTISFELTVLLSASLLAPIQDFEDATARVRAGDFKARVPITSTDEIGALAQSFNGMIVRLEERERLREAFGAYVDPGLAEAVLRDGTLEGDEVDVSVLFVDIRGFTAYAERAGAREVVARLNDFFELVVPILLRHGGHANKFVGDGLLGVFGAPDRHEDHADRAVESALEIAETVREGYGEDLRIGIGVNSGEVMAGTVGGGGRLDFTVIGDTVNTAARVEEATRKTGDDVLITEATRGRLQREACEFEERPAAVMKGKARAVRLYAPTLEAAPGEREAARGLAPAAPPAA
jgi:class 3 adenylate cyclase